SMSRRDWRAIHRRLRRSSCRLEETGVADSGWESWSSCSRDESCSSSPCGSWSRAPVSRPSRCSSAMPPPATRATPSAGTWTPNRSAAIAMSWTSIAPTTRPAPFRRSTTAPSRRERTCFRWRFAPASVHRRCKAAEWARYVSPNVYAVVTLTVVPLVLACARPSPPPRSRFATLPAISAEIADSLQRIELARVPDVEARALLTSHDAAVRIRAALAVGRIGVAEAAGTLRRMLDDPEAGEMAAWALGRIDGGRDALISCLAERCPASRAAARPLSGPVAFKQPAMEALIAALSGPAADDAAFSLGVLARNKDGKGLRQRN